MLSSRVTSSKRRAASGRAWAPCGGKSCIPSSPECRIRTTSAPSSSRTASPGTSCTCKTQATWKLKSETERNQLKTAMCMALLCTDSVEIIHIWDVVVVKMWYDAHQWLSSLEQVTDRETLTPCPFFDSISFNSRTWNSQIVALRTAKIRWSDSQPFPSALNSNGRYLITCPIVDLHIIITHLSPKIVASPLVQPASHLIMITRHNSKINLILIYLS